MKKVLIFAGTTEGRKTAQFLAENEIFCDVCVATEYGGQIMESHSNESLINVMTGRLSSDDMRELCSKNDYAAVIDATHPFAVEVSKNIQKSCSALPVVRYERKIESLDNSKCKYFNSVEECAAALEKETAGNVLLTTGSKNLNVFCKSESLRKRLFARLLPGMESLKLCYDAGLEGKQIIAMQGPFTKKMNAVQIEDYDISVLVTKQSGSTGGVDTKVQAALEAGIECYVIKPEVAEEKSQKSQIKVSSLKELAETLEPILDVKFKKAESVFNIILAGIGMGNPETMTLQVCNAIKNADLIFGACRMVDSLGVKHKASVFPMYLAKDIVPVLEKFDGAGYWDAEVNVVVLFSGDTGFYSGAAKFNDDFKAFAPSSSIKYSIQIFPGVSSLSYLAARLGVSWNDAGILSLHGVEEFKWKEELDVLLTKNKKIFFLTSGYEDVQKLGELLCHKEINCKIGLGFQLSYENEKISWIVPEECKKITETGLYSGMIVLSNKKVL